LGKAGMTMLFNVIKLAWK